MINNNDVEKMKTCTSFFASIVKAFNRRNVSGKSGWLDSIVHTLSCSISGTVKETIPVTPWGTFSSSAFRATRVSWQFLLHFPLSLGTCFSGLKGWIGIYVTLWQWEGKKMLPRQTLHHHRIGDTASTCQINNALKKVIRFVWVVLMRLCADSGSVCLGRWPVIDLMLIFVLNVSMKTIT